MFKLWSTLSETQAIDEPNSLYGLQIPGKGELVEMLPCVPTVALTALPHHLPQPSRTPPTGGSAAWPRPLGCVGCLM